ncbi:GNAT family N-acetyltransferase [Shimazuella kribbensis]|uniref:GNAT family N-acetyltransferase n=1 Tax=Shimazuella kribbensis TaxID=139808 RepID=UPI000401A8A9|nr:GNAT family N-acetyltransferase [Shimazuella kribbensis]
MLLETNRLLLRTLELDLLEAATQRDTKEIEALGYKTNGEWPEPEFAEALPYFRELLIKNNGTKGFDSWIALKKDTKEIVGSVGFLGNPASDGLIEIGFGTNQSHRRKGYCFEAVQKLLSWAWTQKEIKGIVSRCEPDNIGSKNILVKLGFQLDHEDAGFLYWTYRGEQYHL